MRTAAALTHELVTDVCHNRVPSLELAQAARDRVERMTEILVAIHDFLKHGTPVHPGAYLTAEDKPIETVIAEVLA